MDQLQYQHWDFSSYPLQPSNQGSRKYEVGRESKPTLSMGYRDHSSGAFVY